MLDAGRPSLLPRRSWILLAGAGFASWSSIYGFYGKEFWETKEPADWNADDIAKLLTKSPWAKAVSAERTRTRRNTGPPDQMGNPNPRAPGRMGAPRTRSPGTAGSNSPSAKTLTTYKGTVLRAIAPSAR